jgi:predicted DNA-binding transcriptional regulator AlpA
MFVGLAGPVKPRGLFQKLPMDLTSATPADLLTVREVAQRLALSERTVWRWSAIGLLPAPVHLRPRSTRWRARDIQVYLDSLASLY